MKVIILENIKGLGQIGDVKEVKSGYARNFLIPRKLVKLATKGSLKEVEQLKVKLEKIEVKTEKNAEETIKILKDFVLEIKAKGNKSGVLYAAISKKEIVKELKKKGIKTEEENIVLNEPIKKTGEYETKIRLMPEKESTLKIKIVIG